MAVHRFLWLNSLDGRAFWRSLRRQLGLSPNATDVPQEYGKMMEEWAPTREAGRAITARSLAHIIGEEAAAYLKVKRSLRFCPLCLAMGFHSHLFQLEAVALCPYHQCALKSDCPHCGGPLGCPELIPDQLRNPLCCATCGKPFVEEENAATAMLGDFHEAQAQHASTHRVLLRMRAVQRVWVRGLCDPGYGLPDFHHHISHCLIAATGGDKLLPTWSHESLVKVGPIAVKFRDDIANIVDPASYFDPEADEPFSDLLRDCAAIAKSVHRRLAALVRATCGHRQPVPLESREDRTTFTQVQHEIIMLPGDCPCCAVLCWWRAEVSKLMALHELARGIERERGPVVEGESNFRYAMSLHPNLLCATLLTTFSRMATAMRQFISVPSDHAMEHSILRLSKMGGQWKPRWIEHRRRGLSLDGELHLPVSRWILQPSVVGVIVEDRPVWLAHSLSSARQALTDCASLARSGPLWPSARGGASSRLLPRQDIWYRERIGRFSLRYSSRDIPLRLRKPSANDGGQLDLFMPLRDRIVVRWGASRSRT